MTRPTLAGVLDGMPWAERSIANIRREFVLRVLAKEAPMTELCRQYGISRKTGYKWLARFEKRGIEGLVDESRRPRTSPSRDDDRDDAGDHPPPSGARQLGRSEATSRFDARTRRQRTFDGDDFARP